MGKISTTTRHIEPGPLDRAGEGVNWFDITETSHVEHPHDPPDSPTSSLRKRKQDQICCIVIWKRVKRVVCGTLNRASRSHQLEWKPKKTGLGKD